MAHDGELNREVALKEIKGSYADHMESRARFTLEAEITGGLEHPGIVPVYGLGTYGDGRPFYAMRFIRGDSLKQALEEFHAEAFQLTDSERNLRVRRLLQRFIDVCEAIHYAHSRGVLHRDLKPGNIMLGKYGETLVVDWGLARTSTSEQHEVTRGPGEETHLRPLSGSSATMTGEAVGTPAYMSPEQAAGKLDQLGPATDVYALGATLYSILTGNPPIEGRSTGELLYNALEGRIIPLNRHGRQVPKPLEAICLRALATEPTARYATAQALAEEIEHWLADEPVDAYPEPLVARTRRALRKRPMVTGSIFATLLVGLLAFGIGWLVVGNKNRQLSRTNADLVIARKQAIDQRNEAQRQEQIAIAQKKVADDNAQQAQAEKERLGKAMEFLVAAFRKPDPAQDGRELKAADLLLTAAQEAEKTLVDEPLLQAELLHAICQTLKGLGLNLEMLPIAVSVAQIRKELLGPDHPDTFAALSYLGDAYHNAGQPEKARLIFAETLQKIREKLGPGHQYELLAMNNLAHSYRSAGQLDKAIALFEESLSKALDKNDTGDRETLVTMNNLADAYAAGGQYDKALALHEEILRQRQARLGPDHPDTLVTMNNLAGAYEQAGRSDKSVRLNEETLQKMRDKLGADHPNTLSSMNNLADSYISAGEIAKAAKLLEESAAGMRKKLGDDHPATLTTLNNLAYAYQDLGQRDRALEMFQEVLKTTEAKLGPDHVSTLMLMNNVAHAHQLAGNLDKAVPLQEETLRRRRASLGPDHPDTLMSLNGTASVYRAAKRLGEAVAVYEEALQKCQATLGRKHPRTLTTMKNLTNTYFEAKQPAQGLELWREYVAIHRPHLRPASLELASLLANGGANLIEAQAWGAAEEALREALPILEKQQPQEWTTFNTRNLLGGAMAGHGAELAATDKPAAEKLFAEAEPLLTTGLQGLIERQEKIPAELRTILPEAAQRLVDLYTAWEKPEQANHWKAELEKLKSGED